MKKTGLALLVSCLLSSQVFAKDEINLQQLLNERNITQIKSIMESDPNNGEAYYVASIYYALGDDELGTNKDEEKRYAYLEQAANKNWPEAQLQYGFYLLNQGQEIGLGYIQKAAENKYLPAITMLGDLYFAGYQDQLGQQVVEPDIEQSVSFLKQSIEQGNQDARYTLGHIFLTDDFGRKDIVKALSLFEANIDYDKQVGHLPTLITLIDFYTEGKEVETSRAKLLDYYYLASLQEYAPSYYTVGVIQRLGEKGELINIAKNPEAAFINLNKAASNGYIDAMFRVSEMYFKGEGVEQSDVNAYIWMAIAEDLSGSQANYSETILELIPKRQRQIAIDNKNHYRQFFSIQTAEQPASTPVSIDEKE